MSEFTESEVLEGYSDGFNPDSPEPSANRSASYRHGFANGRDDRNHKARTSARVNRARFAEAVTQDTGA